MQTMLGFLQRLLRGSTFPILTASRHLVLAQLMFAILLLAACSGLPRFPSDQGTAVPTQSASAPNLTKPAPSAASPTAATPVPVKTLEIKADSLRGQIIRFWHPWYGETGQVIDALTQEFNLNNPYGILVTSTGFSGYDQLNEKMNASLDTAEAPQVAAGLQHQTLFWDQSRAIIDLTPYVSDPAWGMNPDEQSDFYPNVWDQGLVNGKRYSIPGYRLTQLLYYNETWAKELGYPNPPNTPDDFSQQACAGAQSNLNDEIASNNGTGGWMISTEATTMLGWIYAFGGQILRTPNTGKIESVYQFHSPATEQAFVFLREMFDSGCAFQNQNQDIGAALSQRIALFASGSVAEIPKINEAFLENGSEDDWKVLAFPSPDKEPALGIFGPDYYILESSPEQQLGAWIFIRWLTQPENSAQLIKTTGALPVRKSTLEKLHGYQVQHSQWADAAGLLEYGIGEPAYASWGAVRRAIGDATTQLYRPYFSVELVPGLLDYLDLFAAELHLGPDPGNVFPLGTATPLSRSTQDAASVVTPVPTIIPKADSPPGIRPPSP